MQRLVLFIFVLLAAAVPIAGPVAADDVKRCAGSGDTAIAACSRTIASGKWKGRNLANLYSHRGVRYFEKGEYDRAIADANEAIRLDPKNAIGYGIRGLAYDSKGDYDRAIADASEAIRLDPKVTNVYLNRGSAYDSKGEYDRAIADYSDAIRLNPKNERAYNNRGFAYNAKGEYDRAIADTSEAIRLDPKFPNAYRHRGTAYAGKGDFDRAIAEYDQAIRLNAKYVDAYLGRSIAREKKGDLNGAYGDILDTLALKPESAEAQKRRNELRTALARSDPAATRPTLDPAIASVSPPQPSPTSAPAATPAISRVALVIGNGNYRHATRLTNPSNDATDIAQALRKLGFDVVEGRDLDKRGMDEKLREFGRKLDNAGLALFFYAGHGLQVGGRNYLVPVDAKLERPGDLNLDAVDVGHVLAQMEAERRVNLVFLDACRDNPLARSFARALGTRSTAVGQGLATIQSAIGTMIAYATQPDAVALDGTGRNSPFTTALLKHLTTPGVDIGALMRRVRADVIAATREKQVPWDHSSLVGEVILAQ